MRRKTVLLMLAAVAALAAPATAQADELVDGEGTAVAIGADVTATSTNFEVFSPAFNIVCKLVTLHGEVKENGPEHVTIEKIAVTTQECTRLGGPGGVAFITEPSLTKLTLFKGEGVTTTTFKFDVPSLSFFECHQKGGIALAYAQGTNVIKFGQPPAKLEGSGPGNCPKEGLVLGEFSLEDKSGAPFIIQ